jgi:hypothetical protein
MAKVPGGLMTPTQRNSLSTAANINNRAAAAAARNATSASHNDDSRNIKLLEIVSKNHGDDLDGEKAAKALAQGEKLTAAQEAKAKNFNDDADHIRELTQKLRGNTATPAKPASAGAYPTARNKATGETIIYKDGKWQAPQ